MRPADGSSLHGRALVTLSYGTASMGNVAGSMIRSGLSFVSTVMDLSLVRLLAPGTRRVVRYVVSPTRFHTFDHRGITGPENARSE